MANPHNVELEAAKFLHKLIQESKDEPTKLATKLYVILQHMRSSGKENSMPYQVISRAMETVIKQHGLDIEALMSSRLPLAAGAQVGESGSSQVAGSSQRTGVTKDSKASLTANEMAKPDSYASGMSRVGPTSTGHDMYQGSPSNVTGGAGRVRGLIPAAGSSYQPVEAGMSMPMQFASSSYDNQGFAAKMHKDGVEAFSAAPPSMDLYAGKNIAGKVLEHEGGANILPIANKLNQVGIPSNVSETSMVRSVAVRDTGKSPVAQAPIFGLPFKEHHLKQLRAQCLVFLAFRNGLMPKKLHLEIALGNFFPTEEGACREMIDHKGKELSVNEPNSIPEVSRASGVLDNTWGMSSTGTHAEGSFSKEADNNTSMKEDKSGYHTVPYEHAEDRRHHLALRRKPEAEMPKQETSESQASSLRGIQCDSNTRSTPLRRHGDGSGTNHQQIVIPPHASLVIGTSKPMMPDVNIWNGNGYQREASKVSAAAAGLTHESQQQRKENFASQSQSAVEGNGLGTDSTFPSLASREQWKPIPGMDRQNNILMPGKDSDIVLRNVLPAQETDTEEEDASATADRPPSPKYTTSEKWILDRQKRKLLNEKMWAWKQQKTEQKKIAVCSAKLKESMSSSEDIFAKTKSVIELKELQLLELQRRLRSDILNDFFKPIAPEMDRLKSIKKHRIGRRSKQLERYEQKMKEERQKRIRERQKEFFSEVDVHRERLEDVFKTKRERWKVFNKYVREFHKRKERIHREKIDRIQREKINLLKVNDVEGYLRMVQDAKSDRVKQLLKETEKYLQKLGSKLQEAKTMERRFETDIDDNRTTTIVEKNEIAIENEDETDQAKHYLESNEKYYTMAHSVKENVLEQPASLVGGKLREYQMNGLRWLVSLYNNHLNGILADEMGLGKTVQVISLMCYLMETKNDRGPFLVVVPSSVLPGWVSEINFWAPSIHTIVYSGPPEERRRLFKEQIVHQKFNVLLTTYEYLMNKHDRPKLSKIQWHYVIIDEGHRIKNASCKLNADLKHYRSNHRLLLTGTPLQNNLEELWALLNFLLPNVFNSSEDFSQWFNKPFESNGDNSPDEALLSEEENLLIINRLHQVLRPFVLRRLKHKVENQLPEKIERLIRCEASAYQKLLMKRVEENLGAIGTSKARSVHNSVMELRNICNHPYLSQLHVEEVHDLIPDHYLPNMIRLCGKLEMLDRLLPKLKATDHRVLLFSTMTRLLDVMEDYLCWKQYKYVRLDGHTSGGDRGALIEQFNQPGSPFFIFLLSIRAGGVGVNLQAADTVIIFDTDWNPQVDLQAQARAHRIGQKRDVLVLRLETVQTVEEQVRASAEHKLGVANQSITAGFFDNNTSAEDRREYLEALLRECKKEEAAPVLDDDALNDLIARSESEIDIFESVDQNRREEETGAWTKLVIENGTGDSECLPPLPSRLLTDDDLKPFYEAMKISEASQQGVPSNNGMKRKSDYLGGLDTQQYGRGKRAREVHSYEEQWTEQEFEKMCQVDPPGSPQVKEEITEKKLPTAMTDSLMLTGETQAQMPQQPLNLTVEPAVLYSKEVNPPSKRGRGRPRRIPTTKELSTSPGVLPSSSGAEQMNAVLKVENVSFSQVVPVPECLHGLTPESMTTTVQQIGMGTASLAQSVSPPPVAPAVQPTTLICPSRPVHGRGRGRKPQSGGEAPRRRGKRLSMVVTPAPPTPTGVGKPELETQVEEASSSLRACTPDPVFQPSNVVDNTDKPTPVSHVPLPSSTPTSKLDLGSQEVPVSSSTMPTSYTFPGSLVMAPPNSSSLPTPDAVPSSLITAGVTQPDLLARTAPDNPMPAPSFPSIISGSQSTISHPAPMRGRGRGRKAQSGGEPPRRRGKRQNPEAPVTSVVSIDQDPSLVEPPEKKSRVSVGRRPTTRNKQEHEGLKQANVFDSVASQSTTDPSIGKVFDISPENEAQKPTKMILSDTSKSSVDSVVGSVISDDQDNEMLKPINIVQAGASQGIAEPPVIQASKDHEDNETQTNYILSNASQSTKCLPVGQVCDGSPETEAQIQINSVESDAARVLSNPPTLDERKAEGDNEGWKSKDVKFDPSPGITDSSVTDIENQQGNEAEKQRNTSQSDPSQSKAATPAEASDMEENRTHKPACDVECDDSSRGQRQENEIEGQTTTGQMNASQTVVDPPVVQVDKSVPQNGAHRLNNVVESDSSRSIADPSVVEVQDFYQESDAQKDTDIQSGTAAILPGSDPMVEHGDDKCNRGSRKEVGDEIGEVESSFVDLHRTLSTSVTPVTGFLLGRSDDQARNEEQAKRHSFPEPGCVSTVPKEEIAAQAINVSLNKSDDFCTELETRKEERREAGFSPTMIESSSSVCTPKKQSGEEHAKRRLLDESLVSDPGLTDVSEKGADNSLLLISSNSAIVALKDRSADGKTCTAVSTVASMASSGETVMSADLNGKLGAGEVEQKGSVFDRSQTSDLLNDGTAASDSEVLEEITKIHCDKTVAEEDEKQDTVLGQDSISVLFSIENVASVPVHVSEKSEDLCRKGDGNDPESKATGLDEVFVLKHELTGAGEVEVKDSVFDGPQTSGLLNDAIAEPDSEVLEDISDIHCDKTVTEEEHEKQDTVPSQDSVSVLSSIENVASVAEHALDKSDDPCQKGDGNDPESRKGTGSGEVFALKHELTVIQETSSPTMSALQQEAPELNATVKETMNQAREEDANQRKSKDTSVVESLVPKPEVSEVEVYSAKADTEELGRRGCSVENAHTFVLTHGLASLVPKPEVSVVEVYSAKADAEELGRRGCSVENAHALVLTHDLEDSQSLVQITSSTCSTLEIEDVVAESRNEECENQADNQFQVGDIGKTENVNQAFVPAPESCETTTKSPSAVTTELREDDEEKESSPLQILSMQITYNRATEEKSKSRSGGDFATEVLEGSNMEVDPVADAAFESLIGLDEKVVSDTEIHVARPSANEGKSENVVDSEIIEENPIKDISREAAESTEQTGNLKDDLPEMAEGDSDSRTDDSGKHQSRDGILEKDSVSTFEVTGAQSLEEMTSSTVLVLETENRPSANDGQSENDADLQRVEENPLMDISTEVTVSTTQTFNLKAGLPEMAEGDNDSGRVVSELPATRDHILEKDSVSTVEVTGVQNLEEMTTSSILVRESEVLVVQSPKKECNTESSKESEEVEDGNAPNTNLSSIAAAELCEIETKSANLLDNIVDSRQNIEEQAYSSLETASHYVTPVEVFAEKSEIGSGRDFVAEVQGSKNAELDKTVADAEASEPQPCASVGGYESKDGSANLLNMVNSRRIIGEQASSSLEIASQDVAPAEVLAEKSEIGSGRDFVADVQGSKSAELDKTVVTDAEASEPQPWSNVGAAESKEGSADLLENMVYPRQSIEEASLSSEIASQDVKLAEVFAEMSEIGSDTDFVADVQESKSAELDKTVIANAELNEPQSCTKVEASESKDGSTDLLENMVDSRQGIKEEASLSSEIASQVVKPAEVFAEKSEIGSGRDFVADVQGSKSAELDKTVVADAEPSEPRPCMKVGASESNDGSSNLLENMVYSAQRIEEASLSSEIASQDVTPAEVFAEKSEIGSGRDFVADVQGSKSAELDKTVLADAKASEPQPCTNAGASESKDGLQQLVEEYSDMADM